MNAADVHDGLAVLSRRGTTGAVTMRDQYNLLLPCALHHAELGRIDWAVVQPDDVIG
jgi:hypothetical protein